MNLANLTVDMNMLAPAAVLALWSMVVLFWMTAKRLPAFKAIGVDLTKAEPGGRYVDIEPNLPSKVNWFSHNYTHLMEQPTVFYPVVIILALVSPGETINLYLAWAYTGLRIAHSLWQVLFNIIAVRFVLFALSSVCLFALALHAVMATLA
ncbi:MAG TPA: MAPEG family protein [Pseudomonadales bacterium]|nr:MAPEG family protein [Pseudomonadales bacterium]